MIEPMLAVNAAAFAIKNATVEGKITVVVLLLLSLFSWTIILEQVSTTALARADQKFLKTYAATRDPLDIQRKSEKFDGAPAYQLYIRGADELVYQLKNNPVEVSGRSKPASANLPPGVIAKSTPIFWRNPTSLKSAPRPLTR